MLMEVHVDARALNSIESLMVCDLDNALSIVSWWCHWCMYEQKECLLCT